MPLKTVSSFIELPELLKKNIVFYTVLTSFAVRNLGVGIELKSKILKKEMTWNQHTFTREFNKL